MGLTTETHDGIRTLTLNRPEKRNALSAELVDALMQALSQASADEECRVVLLTGAGDRAFCAGGDLDPRAAAGGPIAMHESRGRFAELIREFRRCSRPIVAQVQGHVAGGGMGLVAACDLAIAADDVTFSTPEIRVGLFPMMIMTLLNRTIPRKNLLEMMLTGEKISANRAVELGFINRAVPRAQLDESARALAAKVASFSPAVLKLGREAFHRMEDLPVDDALDYLCGQLTLNTLTEDAAEGMLAFMMKRPAEWKGR